MKMTVVTESITQARISTITFSVYRNDVFDRAMQHDLGGVSRLACAETVMRYNFVLRNFAMIKDRHNLGGQYFSKKYLNNIRLTPDLRIADEKDLMWFTLQYENVNSDYTVDFPELLDIA